MSRCSTLRASPGRDLTLVLSPALITQTVIANGIDYGGGDTVAVYSDTTGYRIIDALRDAGLG
jgi:hypothetical protein